MLQSIRERAQGWIAWVIVILISVPFALWGIQEYLGVGSEPAKITVNDRQITERQFEQDYRQFRDQLRARLGAAYRPELVDDQLVRNQVVENLIKSELVIQASDRMGLRASNAIVRDFILQVPAFQVDGVFDQQVFERFARQQGMSSQEFEGQIRQSIVSEQMVNAITASELLLDSEWEERVRLVQQTRDMSYLLIPASDYLDTVSLEEGEAEKYYQQNRAAYMAPERVKLEYLELNPELIGGSVEVSDETLQAYYEQQKEEYMSPEQRRASHILISVEEGADEAAVAEARAKAEAALDRVRGGEAFAAVAKELSQDPGSSAQGGDLDFFERGVMVPAFEDAAFSMTKGEMSEPVRSPFGFHIIKLTDIRPSEGKTFAEVKDQIAKAYRENEAQKQYYDLAENLANLAYEDPNSLEPAAQGLGLEIKRSEWMTRDGGPGLFASPKVIRAAFSDDVLNQGLNSELIELGDERVVVVRLLEHEESQPKPFASVQAEIETALKQEKAAQEAQKAGEALLVRLRGGENMEQVAAADGKTLNTPGAVGRNNRELSPELLVTLFRLPRPEEGAKSYGGTALEDGGYAVMALNSVTDGTALSLEANAKRLQGEQARRNLANHYFQHLMGNLRAAAEITVAKDGE